MMPPRPPPPPMAPAVPPPPPVDYQALAAQKAQQQAQAAPAAPQPASVEAEIPGMAPDAAINTAQAYQKAAQGQSVHEERPLEKSRAPPPGAPGQPPEDGSLERGRILWFDRDKNFGFIAAEVGGENVFIHGFDVKGFEPDSVLTRRPADVSFSILMLRQAKNDLCVFIRGRDVGGRLKANEAEVFPETGGPPPPRSWRPDRNLYNQECPCRRRRRP